MTVPHSYWNGVSRRPTCAFGLGLCIAAFAGASALQSRSSDVLLRASSIQSSRCHQTREMAYFRHSVGAFLGQSGEQVKVVQEILRHASSRMTQDVYQQADQTAKRTALDRFSGLFVVPESRSA